MSARSRSAARALRRFDGDLHADLELLDRRERVEVGRVVAGEERAREPGASEQLAHGRPLVRVERRDELEHHAAEARSQALLARALGDQLQLGARAVRIGRRPVVDRERQALVLDRPLDRAGELLEPRAPLLRIRVQLEAVVADDGDPVDADDRPAHAPLAARHRADEAVARDEAAKHLARRLRHAPSPRAAPRSAPACRRRRAGSPRPRAPRAAGRARPRARYDIGGGVTAWPILPRRWTVSRTSGSRSSTSRSAGSWRRSSAKTLRSTLSSRRRTGCSPFARSPISGSGIAARATALRQRRSRLRRVGDVGRRPAEGSGAPCRARARGARGGRGDRGRPEIRRRRAASGRTTTLGPGSGSSPAAARPRARSGSARQVTGMGRIMKCSCPGGISSLSPSSSAQPSSRSAPRRVRRRPAQPRVRAGVRGQDRHPEPARRDRRQRRGAEGLGRLRRRLLVSRRRQRAHERLRHVERRRRSVADRDVERVRRGDGSVALRRRGDGQRVDAKVTATARLDRRDGRLHGHRRHRHRRLRRRRQPARQLGRPHDRAGNGHADRHGDDACVDTAA